MGNNLAIKLLEHVKMEPTNVILHFKNEEEMDIMYKMEVHKIILCALCEDYFVSLFKMKKNIRNNNNTIDIIVPNVEAEIVYKVACEIYGISCDMNIPKWEYDLKLCIICNYFLIPLDDHELLFLKNKIPVEGFDMLVHISSLFNHRNDFIDCIILSCPKNYDKSKLPDKIRNRITKNIFIQKLRNCMFVCYNILDKIQNSYILKPRVIFECRRSLVLSLILQSEIIFTIIFFLFIMTKSKIILYKIILMSFWTIIFVE